MEKRNRVSFIAAWFSLLIGAVTLVLPVLNVTNIRIIFIAVITLYGLINIIKNLFLLDFKEYYGFFKGLNSIIVLVALLFIDINETPWNIALLLFIWIILMSMTKLKEADARHDKKNSLWFYCIVSLIIFIVCGILTTINLYCTGDVQILLIGYLFVINGILEIMEPLINHLLEKKTK